MIKIDITADDWVTRNVDPEQTLHAEKFPYDGTTASSRWTVWRGSNKEIFMNISNHEMAQLLLLEGWNVSRPR